MHIDELKRLMQNGGHREPPLPDSSESVPFGKHRGKHLQILLDDVKYLGWMCRQEGMIEDLTRRFPVFGAALVSAVGTGAPALSKEEKAEKHAELKAKAEEQRAQRAAKQAERERATSAEDKLFQKINTSRGHYQQLYRLAKKVTVSQLQAASPGQRFLHELVVAALERSISILDALPGSASEPVLNEATDAVQALWKDLPASSDWWFNQRVKPGPKRTSPESTLRK
jgi:hypothetical protein